MSRRRGGATAGVLLALSGGWLLAPSAASAAGSDDPAPGLTVRLDRGQAVLGPGDELTFVSTVINAREQPLEDYVAHLNVLTTDESVYVDPEDWSPRRTQYIASLQPGDTVDLTWSVQAVTSGPIVLFVSVTRPDSPTVVSSNPLAMTVGGQREVDSARVLPLVMFTPAAVLALLGAVGLRRRRHR